MRIPWLPDPARRGRDVPMEPLHKLLGKGLFSLQKGEGRKQKGPHHGLVR